MPHSLDGTNDRTSRSNFCHLRRSQISVLMPAHTVPHSFMRLLQRRVCIAHWRRTRPAAARTGATAPLSATETEPVQQINRLKPALDTDLIPFDVKVTDTWGNPCRPRATDFNSRVRRQRPIAFFTRRRSCQRPRRACLRMDVSGSMTVEGWALGGA